jgi:hypothetical protein
MSRHLATAAADHRPESIRRRLCARQDSDDLGDAVLADMVGGSLRGAFGAG